MDQLDCETKDDQISAESLSIELLCENGCDLDINYSDTDFNGLLRFVNDENIDEENKDQLQDLLKEISRDAKELPKKRYISSHETPYPKLRKRAPHDVAPEPCGTSIYFAMDISTSTSIPSSPDRNCSSSPFAPTEVYLPSLPEATSMCRFLVAGTCTKENTIPVQMERIMNERVNEFQALQKKRYREAFAMNSDNLYFDTELLKCRINPKTGKVVSKTAEKVLINYDSAEKQTERIELWKLFDNKGLKDFENRIIALLGDSGMGKTVLVKKICHDWANGKYDQFSFIFYYECGRLDTQKQSSLKDFLFHLSSSSSEKNTDIYQHILRNPEKVLLIFDGFDEFQNPETLIHSLPTILLAGKTNKVQDIFTSIFQKKLLRGCAMLITARPKEKFNQYLGKVDQIIEIMGFTPQQVDCYIKEYFKAKSNHAKVLEWIKDHQYLYSYCYIPFICKCMCLLAESNFNTTNKALSFSSLFFTILDNSSRLSGYHNMALLKEYAAVNSSGLELEYDERKKCELPKHKCPYGLVQSFYKAQHALENMSDSNLVRYISLDVKKRRNQENCPDMVRRLLVGLLYYKDSSPGKHCKAKKKIDEYFKTVKVSELCSHKLLELLHCMVAIHSTKLPKWLASTFSENLSFVDSRITPPDVFVLKHFLKKSKVKLSLDLRKTGISEEGLQELVCLKSITSFRASLSDTVNLWKKLLAEQNYAALKKCVRKFTVEPFKVEHVKDISDLAALVNIHHDICNSKPESIDAVKEIPAVKNLKSIIFGLGKKNGQDGFLKLVEILPKLPKLQVLDLSNLTENHIGDKGVEKLVEKFPKLQTLQILDLSQNNITGMGTKKLAAALPSLCSLQTLSLYNNNVCDMGAEQLADVLPKMTSLEALHLDCNRITNIGARKLAASLQKCPQMKILRMYSMTIPHAVLLHLQKQDSRIICLSIG
ncbi:MHC class II transactivator [Pyxicephalus adspersus]|uniref:MHC class II transactivator n=1 Tax=Pyxicephalus adspersus TaxID=30357 RepID=UPI003B5A8A13